MPNLLKHLRVDAISVVDKGANPGAMTVLMKRAGEALSKEALVNLWKKFVENIGLGSEAGDLENVLKTLEGHVPTLEEISKKLEDVTKEVATLTTSKATSDSIAKIAIEIPKANTMEVLKALEVEISKLDKTHLSIPILAEALDVRKAEVEKADKHAAFSALLKGDKKKKFDASSSDEKDAAMADAEPDTDDQTVGKAMSEVLKANKVLSSKVEKMEKEQAIAKIKDIELDDMKDVAKLDDLAEAIYKARLSNPEAADLLVTQMKALAAQVKTGDLFKQLGAGGTPMPGGTEEKVQKMAEEMAKIKGITVQKAYDEVLLQNPEFYTKMQEERKTK